MSDACDVLVIGAGILGAGAAQAAAAAGYSVRVLEKSGVAAATSCRSSKLVHGGLRYLESSRYGLVRESLRERAILLRIAPHLVRLVPFHVPVYRETRRSRLMLRAGLALYATLDNLRRESWFRALPRREWDSLDGLETRGLKAVFRYQDGQTDDAALTHAVMRSAQGLGAELVLPGEFLDATRIPEGYRVRYRGAHGEEECVGRALVNASGPWVGETLARIAPRPPQPAIELVQGAHIVLEGTLTRGAYYAEAEDGRAVFIMPWRGMTLVGTTETPLAGGPRPVQATPAEIEYLLRTVKRYFPAHDLKRRDAFAGLRVLPKGTGHSFHRTRETIYLTDNPASPRLVSVVGGKLTCYRATAQHALSLLKASLPPRAARADTATRLLEG